MGEPAGSWDEVGRVYLGEADGRVAEANQAADHAEGAHDADLKQDLIIGCSDGVQGNIGETVQSQGTGVQ